MFYYVMVRDTQTGKVLHNGALKTATGAVKQAVKKLQKLGPESYGRAKAEIAYEDYCLLASFRLDEDGNIQHRFHSQENAKKLLECLSKLVGSLGPLIEF